MASLNKALDVRSEEAQIPYEQRAAYSSNAGNESILIYAGLAVVAYLLLAK